MRYVEERRNSGAGLRHAPVTETETIVVVSGSVGYDVFCVTVTTPPCWGHVSVEGTKRFTNNVELSGAVK